MSKKQAPASPALITLASAARQLGVAPATIERSQEDFFAVHRLGHRRYAALCDVLAFIEKKCVSGSPSRPSST
jgi:hypothetical protein